VSLSIRFVPEALRSIAFGSIGAAYMGVGTAFDNPVRILFIQNLTDAGLTFSFDGVNDHFVLPDNGFLLLDVSANKTNERGFFVAEGQRIYVKELGTPTTGSVYLSAFYGTAS